MSETSRDEPTPAQAAEALQRGRQMSQAVVARSAWYRSYLLIYAAAHVLTVLMFGLAVSTLPDALYGFIPVMAIVGFLMGSATSSGLEARWRRQSISRLGVARRQRLVHVTTSLLVLAVLLPGSVGFRGNPAWWVTGALVTGVPALLAYRRETA